MKEKIKEFEKAAIEAVSALRNESGAKCIEMSIRVDDYEKSCRTNVTFFKSIPGTHARKNGKQSPAQIAILEDVLQLIDVALSVLAPGPAAPEKKKQS